MSRQTAVVLGGTGLIGSHLVNYLLDSPHFEKVRILTRRPIQLTHPKAEIMVTDFSDFDQFQTHLGKGDVIFSCIGTTMAQVKGNRKLYREIDFDIPVNAARFGNEAGFRCFLMVSSHLANSRSKFFYTRLKGETEEVISSFTFPSVYIFRPSFLLGKHRKCRPAELAFQKIAFLLKPLLPTAYKPVAAKDVAKAMFTAAINPSHGLHIFHYQEIMETLSGAP